MSALTEDELVSILFKYSAPWYSQNENPVLDAINTGFANIAAFIYSCLLYSKLQARPQTSTDIFLDLYAEDFFSDLLIRCVGQSDISFFAQIYKMMLAQRCTKQAMIDRLTDLTGRVPIVYESFGGDAGFYNHSFLNNMYAGTEAPYQAWITVYRPLPATQNNSAFLNQSAYATAESYYGAADDESTCVNDDDIMKTIEITKLAGTLMHVTILD